MINDECKKCKSLEECPTYVSYGSIYCNMQRARNHQTKGELLKGEAND